MARTSTTRADEIYLRLRSDILNGRLAPGSRLPFAELGARYTASSGVLREALPRLVAEGLVTSEPQLGFRVVSVSIADLQHLTEARVAIETLVLRQSVECADVTWESAVLAAHHTLSRTPLPADDGTINPEWLSAHARFHQVIQEACPNPRLRAIAGSLRDAAEVYRCWSRPFGEEQHRDVAAEHRRIAEAALARDAEAAIAAQRDHIELTARLVVQSREDQQAGSQLPGQQNRAQGSMT